MTFYMFLHRWIVGPLLRKVYHITVEGAEHIPKKTGGMKLIVASNHVKGIDPVLIGISFLYQIAFAAKAELAKTRLGYWLFVEKLEQIEVYRPERIAAMKLNEDEVRKARETAAQFIPKVIKRILGGDVVGFFPEGTRPHDGKMHRFKRGVARAALGSGAAILPVFIRYDKDEKIEPLMRWLLQRQFVARHAILAVICETLIYRNVLIRYGEIITVTQNPKSSPSEQEALLSELTARIVELGEDCVEYEHTYALGAS